MARVLHKIEFAGPGADGGLFSAAIPDFARNRETDADGRDVEKTTWHPGDIYHFLIQHDPGLRLTAVKSSWGSAQSLGQVTRSHSEDIQLAEADDTAETSYIPSGNVAARWYGNSPALATEGRAIRYASGPLPAIGAISYSARWHSYRLVPAALSLAEGEEWPVLIVAYLDLVNA